MHESATRAVLVHMSLVALAAAATTAVVPYCSWDHPGRNPYMGDVPAAVDRYPEIPSESRQRLKARMERHAFDDVVVISRDTIVGRGTYAPQLKSMQFGNGTMCREVSRERWGPQHEERGLVYCDGPHCIVVPSVCRNVSLLQRIAPPALPPAADGPPELVLGPPGVLEPPGVVGPPGILEPPGAAVPPTSLTEPPTTFDGGGPPGIFRAPFDWFPMHGSGFFLAPAAPPALAIPEADAWRQLLCGLTVLAVGAGIRRWWQRRNRRPDGGHPLHEHRASARPA